MDFPDVYKRQKDGNVTVNLTDPHSLQLFVLNADPAVGADVHFLRFRHDGHGGGRGVDAVSYTHLPLRVKMPGTGVIQQKK